LAVRVAGGGRRQWPGCDRLLGQRGISQKLIPTVVAPHEAEELNPKQVKLVRRHLESIVASPAFAGSKRAQDFLTLIVHHALAREFDSLRERQIGIEMFKRSPDYDTGSDSVVRVKATEVRKKLAHYYFEEKENRGIRIELPIGTYVPKFHFEYLPQSAAAADPDRPDSTDSVQTPVPAVNPPVEDSGPVAVHAVDKKPPDPAPEIRQIRRFSWRGVQFGTRLTLGIVCLLCLILVTGYVAFRLRRSGSTERSRIRSIAILPFTDLSGDSQQEYFADGMTEQLIADLGEVSTLSVISRTSAMTYKGSKKELPQIAHELGVDGVVEGSVLRAGKQIRITARLVDGRTDHPLWSHTYFRDLTNVLSLQGELAQDIANEVSTDISPDVQARLSRSLPVNAHVEDLYLQGRLLLNASDPNAAVPILESAISADPNFAQAHAALAECYDNLGEAGDIGYNEAFFKEKTEATKAIELDESLSEGHAGLANAAMNLDWDWTTAAREFARALELNPNSALIHARYSIFLKRMGRLDESAAEAERSAKLDPNSPRALINLGFAYYSARQYDRAFVLLRSSTVPNLDLRGNPWLWGDLYAEKGQYAKSIGVFLKLGDSPHALGHLGNAYARAGDPEAARKTIVDLKRHVAENGVGRYEIALVYAALGENDQAFLWLEEAYKTHNEGLTNLKIDPCLDRLRTDPRFDDLVHRVGLS
jgi:TolB-like protein/Tfp pilus assembly protein PilF